MYFSKSLIALVAAYMGAVSAAPAADVLPRGLDAGSCNNPVEGLSKADCEHMAKIGFASQGVNAKSDNGFAWIGNNGANKFNFHNQAGVDVALVMWEFTPGVYNSQCVNVKQAAITYSIAKDKSVTISVDNGKSGAFAGLYNQVTNLSQAGQVNNVFGEFTSGQYGTIDVSREVNMQGNHMSIKVQNNGCVSEWTPSSSRCLFQCKSGNSCLEDYELVNCQQNSQPGATYGQYLGKDSGGCQGWSNGGNIDVTFLN